MTEFEKLTNDILLRIPSYETDTVTKDFLSIYCPTLVNKPTGIWISQQPIAIPKSMIFTRHCLSFSKHPFLDINMKEARLDVLTMEEGGKNAGYLTYFINFFFNNRQEADNFFEYLCSQYELWSVAKTKIVSSGRCMAIYEMADITTWLTRVQFTLTNDDFYNGRYKIIFGQVLDERFDEYYSSQ